MAKADARVQMARSEERRADIKGEKESDCARGGSDRNDSCDALAGGAVKNDERRRKFKQKYRYLERSDLVRYFGDLASDSLPCCVLAAEGYSLGSVE